MSLALSLELAARRLAAAGPGRKGLLGRDGVEGALLLRPARSIHTIGMRFPIDVAWCDADLVVLRVATVARHRVTMPVRGAQAIVEAEAGSFARWGLAVGDKLEVRTAGAQEGSEASS